jgi:TfoX/Sxy family transcriptional regulator of competence genes
MAKEYLEKLTKLVAALKLEEELSLSVEVKHFFSGAALYANGTIAVTWSPVGLAFKLPQQEAEVLIAKGKAKPLKYFPKGHVKKGYALFEAPDLSRKNQWKAYFLKAIRQTQKKGVTS